LPRRSRRRVTARKVGRFRVICHLPTQKEGEERAATKAIDSLGQLATLGGFEGFTVSVVPQTAFHGYWRPDKHSQLRKENVVLCIVDVLPRRGVTLSDFALRLKRRVSDLYVRSKAPQKKVWVVAYPVDQYD